MMLQQCFNVQRKEHRYAVGGLTQRPDKIEEACLLHFQEVSQYMTEGLESQPHAQYSASQ